VELDEDTWAHGFYRVTFTYRLSTPVSQLIAQCREERSITSQSAWHGDSSFSMTRMHGGVSQRVAVNKRVAKSDVSAETETGAYASVVTVTETAIEDVAPLAFYVGARRPPPVPMIEVPFAPGVLAHSVSLVGFDDLFSGKGAFSYQQRAGRLVVSCRKRGLRGLGPRGRKGAAVGHALQQQASRGAADRLDQDMSALSRACPV
jgi:hypothetical protein